MLKKMTLQNRLTGSFVFMGGIVLAVALVGWNGNSQLNEHIETLSRNSVPSIRGLWKINEGQTQIQSSQRALADLEMSQENKQTELERIQAAWQQIKDGFAEYETTPQTPSEAKLYQTEFLPDWQAWQKDHEEFMQLYRNASQNGISAAESTSLSQFLAQEERASFDAATENMLTLLEISNEVAKQAEVLANQDASRVSNWVLMGMLLGPLSAIALGVYFSRAIAKPLGAKISNIVRTIVSSSTEIAATVEQHERTASQQAAAVGQTTTTMDELSASSRQSAEQAESAAAGARHVAALVDGTSATDRRTGTTAVNLKDSVGQIAEQIVRLSEQTSQIGNISSLVSDLANQTNMLALNAAVEAARAGEHGKGFAVVAGEIRKLADQSRKSAERINALVADIQNTTNSTVMVTDEGTKTVYSIVDAINDIALNSQQISLTAKQQAIAVAQVVEAMNTLSQGAVETASGITQTKVGTQKLNEAALALQAIV